MDGISPLVGDSKLARLYSVFTTCSKYIPYFSFKVPGDEALEQGGCSGGLYNLFYSIPLLGGPFLCGILCTNGQYVQSTGRRSSETKVDFLVFGPYLNAGSEVEGSLE